MLLVINWEGHRNFNDLQYIIRGKVGMGVAHLQHPKNTVKVPEGYDSIKNCNQGTRTPAKLVATAAIVRPEYKCLPIYSFRFHIIKNN